MFAAISPSSRIATPAVAVHGVGTVSYHGAADGKTQLRDLFQRDPIRILFPTPPRSEIPSAVFVTTSGGLVGGDILEMTAQVSGSAAALFYPQAAEKIYRSAGPDCCIDVTLRAEAGCWLEWLPQETILFDGARIRRMTRADIAPGGRMLAGEILVLGRGAMGETLRSGLVRDDWEIYRDGKLVWTDALCLEGDIENLMLHPAGLAGATAIATIVYAGDDAPAHLDHARTLLKDTPEVRVGATLVNGVLVVRLLAADPYQLRKVFGNLWAGFRHEVAGLPAKLPRLWHI